jgi:WD40 repeat protein
MHRLVISPGIHLFSDDKTIRLWNAKDRSIMAMTELDAMIRSVAVSPDGSLVAAGFKSGQFAIFSGKDLKEVVG